MGPIRTAIPQERRLNPNRTNSITIQYVFDQLVDDPVKSGIMTANASVKAAFQDIFTFDEYNNFISAKFIDDAKLSFKTE